MLERALEKEVTLLLEQLYKRSKIRGVQPQRTSLKNLKEQFESLRTRQRRHLKIERLRHEKTRKQDLLRLKSILLEKKLPASIWDIIIDPTVNVSTTDKEALHANSTLYDNLAVTWASLKAQESRLRPRGPSKRRYSTR